MRETLSGDFVCFFSFFFFAHRLCEKKPTTFFTLNLISLPPLWSWWVNNRERARSGKCIHTWAAESELRGSAFLSIIKHSRFYRHNTRAQTTNNPAGVLRAKTFQPTRGRSPRLHVAFNPLNPPIGLMLEEFCWCLGLCACACVFASPCFEPQLNPSDISSHVLFPHYTGPTVTQCVRAGTTVSHANAHILISTHAASLPCIHTPEGASRRAKKKKAQKQIKPSAR